RLAPSPYTTLFRSRHDRARALREGNEEVRGNERPRRRPPPGERLDPSHSTLLEPDLRLKIDVDLALLHGTLEIALDLPEGGLPARGIRTVQRERELVLARFLQRKLRSTQQARRVVRMRRIDRDADRQIHDESVAADHDVCAVVLGQTSRRFD